MGETINIIGFATNDLNFIKQLLPENQFSFYYKKDSNILAIPESYDLCLDNICKDISQKVSFPILMAGIYDGDFWYYSLFNRGEKIDQYQNYINYFSEDKNNKNITENIEIVCDIWPNLNKTKLQKYYRDIESVYAFNLSLPANLGDSFSFDSGWQVVDFLKRFNLHYPNAGFINKNKVALFCNYWLNIFGCSFISKLVCDSAINLIISQIDGCDKNKIIEVFREYPNSHLQGLKIFILGLIPFVNEHDNFDFEWGIKTLVESEVIDL